MKTKFIFSLAFFLLLTGLAEGGEKEGYILLNFHRVDINQVIKFVGEVTETNFIIDPRVRGEITVISSAGIPVEAVYSVFKSILEMHGFSLVQAGEMVKIIPSMEARQRAIRTGIGRELEEIAPTDTIITQLIPLKHADVNHVRAALAPLISMAGNMVVHLPTNTLILTETSSNIQRLLRIVREIDVETMRVEREIILLEFASAEALMPILTSALAERPLPGEMALKRAPMIIPEVRTNSLMVVSTPQDMVYIRELIERLDKKTPPPLTEVRIYHLENAKAVELIKILNELQANRAPARGAPTLEVKPNIVADETTNSLIIVASPQDHAIFRKVIEELDIRPRQVLVEMLIAEVSLDLATRLGIELAGLVPGVEGFLRPDLGKAMVTTAAVRAILQTYKKHADFEVLATPHIITSNNEEAHIMIGERVPYVREARVTEERPGVIPTVIKTFGYRDVGIELKITPRITPDRFVHLEIEGKISKAVGVPINGTLHTIERRVSTMLTVEDESTVVIGGLIRDDKAMTLYRVPLLGDIPVLGAFFRRESETAVQRNLLIFITPYVIETAEEAEEIRKKKDLELEKFKEEKM
jgi:general secretion pathway protein D